MDTVSETLSLTMISVVHAISLAEVCVSYYFNNLVGSADIIELEVRTPGGLLLMLIRPEGARGLPKSHLTPFRLDQNRENLCAYRYHKVCESGLPDISTLLESLIRSQWYSRIILETSRISGKSISC